MPTTSKARAAAHQRPRARRLGSGDAIRDAAARLFLERGYQGTSMDEIAAAAQVSKQTIYTHFADKEALFTALVMANADRVEGFLAQLGDLVRSATDVEDGLTRLADAYLSTVIRPEVLRLRRLVLAEAGRFPHLARTYYEGVPARMYSTLSALFEELDRAGSVRVPDPRRAAEQFAWLVLGAPLDRGMFIEPAPSDLVSPTTARDAVRTFLAAYGR